MQMQLDLKNIGKLLVFKIKREYGIQLGFSIFSYKNVIGINSRVGGERHVIFGDYEKKINSKKIKEVMLENNVALLCFFKSSKGKYHFIVPQVFDWLDALRISKELGAEYNFLSISAVRQDFILRVSKKGVKGEPKLVKIFFNPKAVNVKFSYQHSKFLNIFYGLDNRYLNYPKINGDKLNVECYRTTNI